MTATGQGGKTFWCGSFGKPDLKKRNSLYNFAKDALPGTWCQEFVRKDSIFELIASTILMVFLVILPCCICRMCCKWRRKRREAKRTAAVGESAGTDAFGSDAGEEEESLLVEEDDVNSGDGIESNFIKKNSKKKLQESDGTEKVVAKQTATSIFAERNADNTIKTSKKKKVGTFTMNKIAAMKE